MVIGGLTPNCRRNNKMNWELLTGPDFEKAIEKCGKTCLLPIGVIEKHGDHLPTGQDAIYIHRVSTLAAEQETAMVFPFYYFGQILEAKHVPGTIAMNSSLIIPVLENMCDEIARNGFDKILIVDGHGGNGPMLGYFLHKMLDKEKKYMVYVSNLWSGANNERIKRITEAKVDGHGGEKETCRMLKIKPELVKLDKFADYGLPLKRIEKFEKAGIESGIGWYSNYPGHFCGDKVTFSKEKGSIYLEEHMNYIVIQIKLIKKDDTPLK